MFELISADNLGLHEVVGSYARGLAVSGKTGQCPLTLVDQLGVGAMATLMPSCDASLPLGHFASFPVCLNEDEEEDGMGRQLVQLVPLLSSQYIFQFGAFPSALEHGVGQRWAIQEGT